jgi:hypothetical protein
LLTAIFLRTKKRALVKSFSRIGFLLLFMGVSISIFIPKIIQILAEFLGVGRGADLLIYATATATLIFGILVFVKIKELEGKLVKVSREIALMKEKSD